MKVRGFLIGLLMIGLTGTVYGGNVVDEMSIVPVHYENKAFIKGQYRLFNEENFEVYSQEDTVYLPLRLVTDLLSSLEENWEVDWEASKPNKAYLRCQFMQALGKGGAVTTGKEPLVIEVTLDSTVAKVGDKEMTLSKPPKKIGGSLTLPLRSTGELLGKSVSYRDGLVILSKEALPVESQELESALKEVKTKLEAAGQKAIEEDWAEQITNVEGVSYYTKSHYEGDQTTYSLYSQRNGQAPKCLKQMNEATYINGCFIEGKFYYIQEGQLHRFDLKGRTDEVILKLPDEISGFINRLFVHEGELYLVNHEGDWTMGSESLFKIVAGKAEQVASCHQFGSIVIDGEAIYYATMDNIISSPNLFKVYQGKTTEVGAASYVYDMGIEVTEGGIGAYWLQENAFILNDKFYILGYKEENTKGAAVYAIDLNTQTQQQVTDLTTEFWRIDHRIYYIDTNTQYLKVIDLESGISKTLIQDPIEQAKFKANKVYYSLKGNNSEVGEGLYTYDFGTGQTVKISEQLIKDFEIGQQGVIYLAQGYQSGLYKWQNNETSLVESRLLNQVIFGENSLWYNLYEENGSFTIAY